MTHLVVSFSNHWPMTLANELEYVTKKLTDGDTVHVLSCNGGLEYCRYKVYEDEQSVCDRCIHRRTAVYRHFLTNPKFKILPLYIEDAEPITHNWTTKQVEALVVDNVPIGIGCLSSLIYENRRIDFDCELPNLISRYIATATQVVRSLKKFLSSATQYDYTILFNGRFCEEYAARRLFMLKNIPFVTHENTIDGRVLFLNGKTPQMISVWEENALSYVDRVKKDPRLEEIGNDFFYNRKRGVLTNDTVYIKSDYKPLEIPEWAIGRRIIAVFNSSEDEIRFTDFADEYSSSFVCNQYEGIRLIVDRYRGDANTLVIIRIHPNLATGNLKEVQNIESLSAANIIVVSPQDKISSYSILETADVVVSMLSTIGVEATYWGVPSIALLPSGYTSTGAAQLVTSANQLFDLIEDPDIKPSSKFAAISYGAMLMSVGEEFEHVVGQFPNILFKNELLTEFGMFPIESKWYVRLCKHGMSPVLACYLTKPLRILSRIKSLIRR